VATPINHRLLFKLLSFLAIAIFGTYLFIYYDLYLYFIQKEKTIAFIEYFHPFDEFVFIALQILQVVAAPIPGEATGIIGGYLYGPLLGTIYSTIGLTIGSWIAFALARTFGLPLVEKTVKPEIIRKYDNIMEHQGILVSFVLFLIPGFPKDYLCYILGLSHIGTGAFLVISTIGRLFGTVLLTVSGSCARNNQYGTLLVITVVSGVFVLVGCLYRDRLLELLRKRK
jgi:uncharacterized membrane protein YdjX (TVP38/TMEM64 family)